MSTGKIVEIERSKGYGFIEGANGERIFFHQRWLKKIRFRDLKPGDEVAFLINQGPRGPRAFNMIYPEDIPIPKKQRIAELLFND
jgi:CspA family cold shock protein